MPLPAQCCRPVQAADKTVKAKGLSLRGGRRPTWRPEREARGSALGVQSRGGTSGENATAFPRLPRPLWGLAMTHQGGAAVHQSTFAVELSPAGRSMSAATDAIGRCVFIGTLYELEVPSRDCHGPFGASQ